MKDSGGQVSIQPAGEQVGDLPQVEAQSFAVKRAEVEFHNFASLGEPERAIAHYAEQNRRRGAVIRNHLDFIGPMSPFLEIGSNVGHTSYLLENEFGVHPRLEHAPSC